MDAGIMTENENLDKIDMIDLADLDNFATISQKRLGIWLKLLSKHIAKLIVDHTELQEKLQPNPVGNDSKEKEKEIDTEEIADGLKTIQGKIQALSAKQRHLIKHIRTRSQSAPQTISQSSKSKGCADGVSKSGDCHLPSKSRGIGRKGGKCTFPTPTLSYSCLYPATPSTSHSALKLLHEPLPILNPIPEDQIYSQTSSSNRLVAPHSSAHISSQLPSKKSSTNSYNSTKVHKSLRKCISPKHPSHYMTKATFLSMLGLVTPAESELFKIELEKSKMSRKRRSTANPKYASYTLNVAFNQLHPKRKNCKPVTLESLTPYERHDVYNKMILMDSTRFQDLLLRCFTCDALECNMQCKSCSTKYHSDCVRIPSSKAQIPKVLTLCPKCVHERKEAEKAAKLKAEVTAAKAARKARAILASKTRITKAVADSPLKAKVQTRKKNSPTVKLSNHPKLAKRILPMRSARQQSVDDNKKPKVEEDNDCIVIKEKRLASSDLKKSACRKTEISAENPKPVNNKESVTSPQKSSSPQKPSSSDQFEFEDTDDNDIVFLKSVKLARVRKGYMTAIQKTIDKRKKIVKIGKTKDLVPNVKAQKETFSSPQRDLRELSPDISPAPPPKVEHLLRPRQNDPSKQPDATKTLQTGKKSQRIIEMKNPIASASCPKIATVVLENNLKTDMKDNSFHCSNINTPGSKHKALGPLMAEKSETFIRSSVVVDDEKPGPSGLSSFATLSKSYGEISKHTVEQKPIVNLDAKAFKSNSFDKYETKRGKSTTVKYEKEDKSAKKDESQQLLQTRHASKRHVDEPATVIRANGHKKHYEADKSAFSSKKGYYDTSKFDENELNKKEGLLLGKRAKETIDRKGKIKEEKLRDVKIREDKMKEVRIKEAKMEKERKEREMLEKELEEVKRKKDEKGSLVIPEFKPIEIGPKKLDPTRYGFPNTDASVQIKKKIMQLEEYLRTTAKEKKKKKKEAKGNDDDDSHSSCDMDTLLTFKLDITRGDNWGMCKTTTKFEERIPDRVKGKAQEKFSQSMDAIFDLVINGSDVKGEKIGESTVFCNVETDEKYMPNKSSFLVLSNEKQSTSSKLLGYKESNGHGADKGKYNFSGKVSNYFSQKKSHKSSDGGSVKKGHSSNGKTKHGKKITMRTIIPPVSYSHKHSTPKKFSKVEKIENTQSSSSSLSLVSLEDVVTPSQLASTSHSSHLNLSFSKYCANFPKSTEQDSLGLGSNFFSTTRSLFGDKPSLGLSLGISHSLLSPAKPTSSQTPSPMKPIGTAAMTSAGNSPSKSNSTEMVETVVASTSKKRHSRQRTRLKTDVSPPLSTIASISHDLADQNGDEEDRKSEYCIRNVSISCDTCRDNRLKSDEPDQYNGGCNGPKGSSNGLANLPPSCVTVTKTMKAMEAAAQTVLSSISKAEAKNSNSDDNDDSVKSISSASWPLSSISDTEPDTEKKSGKSTKPGTRDFPPEAKSSPKKSKQNICIVNQRPSSPRHPDRFTAAQREELIDRNREIMREMIELKSTELDLDSASSSRGRSPSPSQLSNISTPLSSLKSM